MSETVGGSEAQIQLKVLFFATLKERVGAKAIDVSVPVGMQVATLRMWLAEHYPDAAAAIPSALVAINHEFASETAVLFEGAEVALFPPVSGGSDQQMAGFPTICELVEGALDLDGLLKQITLPTTGAACLFAGMVRAETRRDGYQQTAYLEYESYQEMAMAKMGQVAREIRDRWPAVEGIVIVQRIGRLMPGTPTVLMGCSAAHRDTGVFEAARYGIDRLKEIVPIWKKEVGPDGSSWVEGNYQPAPGE
jgi:molybdopterin synthase catalytic subunit